MSKRVAEETIDTRKRQVVDLDAKISRGYVGYVPEEDAAEIETVAEPLSADEVKKFYERYVLGRRPCKIKIRSGLKFEYDRLSSDKILDTLPGEEILQAERKVEGGFGSGAKRTRITLRTLIERLKEGDYALYLTTQYDGEPSDSEEESDQEEEFCKGDMSHETGEEHAVDEAHAQEEHVESAYSQNNTSTRSDVDTEADNSETFITALENVSSSESDVDPTHDDYEDLLQEDAPITTLFTGPLYEAEAVQRVRELYQPPLTTIAGKLPMRPAFLTQLIPQQVNLWMGSTGENTENVFVDQNFKASDTMLGFGRHVPGGGTSSGLHHDHADNIYIPVEGRKRFTMFSPADAAKMYTVGDINTVFNTGVINYTRNKNAPYWRNIRDDGALVAEIARHRLQTEEETLTSIEKQQLMSVLEEDRDDFEQVAVSDPPHFSKIPPAVVHLDKIKDEHLRKNVLSRSEELWPLFKKAKRMYVDLQPGEMLWMPAGWFHEVTSFGHKENHIHTAINYWFIPPNGSTMEEPYKAIDKYWPIDFKRTKASIDYYVSDSIERE